MREFIAKYEDRIHGVLSCFDRMLFRGYLPIMSGWQMAQFFNSSNIRYRELKPFLLEHAARVKQHGVDVAEKEGRPFQYLQEKVNKEDLARKIAERDHIENGLICVLSVLEPCRTFSFRSEKGRPFVASARRKCLFLYYYFMDRDFGLIHVKLQTWFPLQIQVYVNGHEWLARNTAAWPCRPRSNSATFSSRSLIRRLPRDPNLLCETRRRHGERIYPPAHYLLVSM